jgi:3-dehydroquinate dehydratase-2
MKILVLHGPNLNLLGQREPETYGTFTLEELNRRLAMFAEDINARRSTWRKRVELYFYQSNHEGILVDTIQSAPHNYAGIVYNPAAHTHYSIALRDAIASIPIPVVEVHLSNIAMREGFRSLSVMSDVCIAQFKGRGIASYQDGIETLVNRLDEADSPYPPLGMAVVGGAFADDLVGAGGVFAEDTASGAAVVGVENAEDTAVAAAEDAEGPVGGVTVEDAAPEGVAAGKPAPGVIVEVDTAVQEIDFKSALEKLHD